jgi:hypothetical protein
MSTVRNVARVPRRATDETPLYSAPVPALIPPAEPTQRPARPPNPWAETLGVFLIVGIIVLAIYLVAVTGLGSSIIASNWSWF